MSLAILFPGLAFCEPLRGASSIHCLEHELTQQSLVVGKQVGTKEACSAESRSQHRGRLYDVQLYVLLVLWFIATLHPTLRALAQPFFPQAPNHTPHITRSIHMINHKKPLKVKLPPSLPPINPSSQRRKRQSSILPQPATKPHQPSYCYAPYRLREECQERREG